MADNFNYTHLDINRYLNKKMTKQEMHDFEKAMMEDPFLADAYEGFAKTNADVADRHLIEIEKNLTIKEEKAKIVAMAQNNFAWWKTAVRFIFIAGAGVIGYQLLNTNSGTTEIAVNRTAPPIGFKPDSIGPQQKPLATPELLPSQKQDVAALSKSSPIINEEQNDLSTSMNSIMLNTDSIAVIKNAEENVVAKNETARTITQAAPQTLTRPVEPMLAGRAPGINATREFKGKVLDPSGEPLPFATIHGNKSVGTVADADGRFSLRAPDSVLDVSVVVMGYGTTKVQLKSSNATNEILVREKAESDLAEIVVTDLAKRRQEKANTKPNIIINKGSGVEPLQGWRRFEKYMIENIEQLKDSSDIEPGEVEVEFTIDENSKPINIKVLKTVSELNAAKAIELLQNGPKWKRRKINDKAVIVIKF